MTIDIERPPVETRGGPDAPYLQQLRALGAWWCLGSSALEPALLTRYTRPTLAPLRRAGL